MTTSDHNEPETEADTRAEGPPISEGGGPRTPEIAPLPHIEGFTVTGILGEGGMGAVYDAWQHTPRRRVALKLVRPGLMSAKLLKRFSLEVEVLGRLEHPTIGRIYAAGTSEAGGISQPYFAMEYIEGKPITDYVTDGELSTRERIELLMKVVEGVHHAHQKGVIHRDLKPANILVTEEGEPKILDFGVARVTEGDVHLTTMPTDIGILVGTLQYMSPEQATGQSEELDTRTDVYALGVVAYEVLTGERPYKLDQQLIHEAARIINETEPTRLSSINRTLRGDLETIVGKSLEKEKERRYASASALAADLARYLNDEPIAARPASAVYQLTKFARRNKVLVASSIAIFLAVLAGGIFSALGFLRASRAETVAVAERKVADEQRLIAQKRLVDMLVAEGDMLAGVSRWNEAKANYTEARGLCRLLGVSDLSARLGEWVAYGKAPPPVCSVDADMDVIATACMGSDAITVLANGTVVRRSMSDLQARHHFTLPERPASVTFADNSSLAVIVYSGGKIETRDMSNGSNRTEVRDAGFIPGATAVDPGGRICLLGRDDGSIEVWECQTAKKLRSLSGHKGKVLSLAISDDAHVALSGAADDLAMTWDLTTGERLHVFDKHSDWVFATDLSHDGKRALTGSGDHFTAGAVMTLAIWDAASGAIQQTFHGHNSGLTKARLLEDKERVLSSDFGGQIKFWDKDSGMELASFAGHDGALAGLNMGEDGNRIVSASGAQIKVWDTHTHSKRRLNGRQRQNRDAALSPDEKLLAVCGNFGILVTIDVESGSQAREFRGHDGNIWDVDFAHEGNRIVTSGEDGTVRVWDTATARELHRHTFDRPVYAVAPLSDGTILVAGDHHEPMTWSPATDDIMTYDSLGGKLYDIISSPDGKRVFACGKHGKIGVWETGSGRLLASLQTPADIAERIAVSDDGKLLLAGTNEGTLSLFDLRHYSLVHTFSGNLRACRTIQFVPDSTLAITGDDFGSINVWDWESGEELRYLKSEGGNTLDISFLTNGNLIVTRTATAWEYCLP